MRDEVMNHESNLKKRLKKFSLYNIKLYTFLPQTAPAQVMGKQLLRSATSVGANYCEAHRARSTAEFVSKLHISLQELEETKYWLELLVESQTVTQDKTAFLQREVDEIIAILTAIVIKLKNNK